MIFSDTHWLRINAKKLDIHLRKILLSNYKYNKLIPCFLHSLVSKARLFFKKVDVVIKLADSMNPDEQRSMDRMVKIKRKAKSNHRLKLFNAYPARISPNKIKKLLEKDYVKAVYLDRKYKALLDIASPTLNAPFAWNTGLTGKGITTAVIDTGIYPHDDLIKPVNRIIAFKDFVRNKTKPYDDNGHGTHVAGDIAANGLSSQGLYKAPAFESSLVGVKVLNKIGTGNLSTIISGIEWCIENKDLYNIRIICMSLGAEAGSSYTDDLLCEAVEAAWNNGIVVCVAAGNEGPESKTIASPGIDPLIITVGASNDKNTSGISDDNIADFSSRGPTVDGLDKPDIVTPGVSIISLRSPGSYLDKNSKSSRVGSSYISLSGTSMATPLCCGCIALLLENKPDLLPEQVKKVLTGTSVDLGYDVNVQGYGQINIKNVLNWPPD